MKDYARKPYMSDNYREMMRTVPQKAIFDVLQEYGRFEKQSMFKKPYLMRNYEEMENVRNPIIPYVDDPYDDGNFPPLDAILLDQPEDSWPEFEDAIIPAKRKWLDRLNDNWWYATDLTLYNPAYTTVTSWDSANNRWVADNTPDPNMAPLVTITNRRSTKMPLGTDDGPIQSGWWTKCDGTKIKIQYDKLSYTDTIELTFYNDSATAVYQDSDYQSSSLMNIKYHWDDIVAMSCGQGGVVEAENEFRVEAIEIYGYEAEGPITEAEKEPYLGLRPTRYAAAGRPTYMR